MANDLEAMQLRSDTPRVYANLSGDYVNLGRLKDAESVLRQGRAKKMEQSLLPNFYQLAFLENDDQQMQKDMEQAEGSELEDLILSMQSDTEAYYGRLREAREFSKQAIAAALRAERKEEAAGWAATAALREAEIGNPALVRKQAAAALALAPTRDVKIASAMALARSGDAARAEGIVSDIEKQFPENTLLEDYWLPAIRAALALQKNNSRAALDFLETTSSYDLGGGVPPFTLGATLYPSYLRGQAYLAQHEWEKAAREFEHIREHRGVVWNFPTAILAELGLARAYAGEGDVARAKVQYQAFLTLWQNADADNPVLRQAQIEYAKLQ